MAVDHVEPVLFKKPFNQEVIPHGLGVERFEMVGMNSVSNIHVNPPTF
jgi:hypothetical protein